MNLVGKVPVEPLDDERLTNIERNLVVRVSELSQQRGLATAGRGARRLFAVAAIAMVVLVAGAVGWRLRDGAPVAGARPEQLAMKAGALDLGDAQIAGSDFTVTRTPSRVEIVMQPGLLDLHVEHRPERLFVVRAGDVEIEDVGTRFTVDYDGKNVDVRVTEGEVKVKHAGKDVAITASNAWTLELGPITIAQLEARTQHGTQVAAAEPGATDANATDATSTARGPSDTAAAIPSPGVTGTGTSAATGTAGSGAGSGAGPGNNAVRAASGTSTPTKKPGKSNARKALEEAKLEPPDEAGTDDPMAAIAAYRERLKTLDASDKWRVLYSIAYMQHRANQDDAALHTIGGALRRRAGPAYKAALWLEVRIRCLKAFDDACRIAAQKYQANFSGGLHAGVAQEILKEISRGP
jgi:hypothetical protein